MNNIFLKEYLNIIYEDNKQEFVSDYKITNIAPRSNNIVESFSITNDEAKRDEFKKRITNLIAEYKNTNDSINTFCDEILCELIQDIDKIFNEDNLKQYQDTISNNNKNNGSAVSVDSVTSSSETSL